MSTWTAQLIVMRRSVACRLHTLPCYISNLSEQICTSLQMLWFHLPALTGFAAFYRLLESRVGVVVVKGLPCKNRPSSVNVILKPISLILLGIYQNSNCADDYHPDTPHEKLL